MQKKISYHQSFQILRLLILLVFFKKKEDFFYSLYGSIFQVMLDLFAKNIKIEPISVINELEKLKIEIKDYNHDALIELASFYPFSKSVVDHTRIVKDFSLRRKLITP